MSTAIGFVHNHESSFYGRSPDEKDINRYPSANDWATAGRWVKEQGAGSLNTEGFSLYIVDSKRDMREFKYSDRAIYERLNVRQNIDGARLPVKENSGPKSC